MKLLTDTGSVANWMMDNGSGCSELKVGNTFAELLWTDRRLWVIKSVKSNRDFIAEMAETRMKDWTDGTEYPVVVDGVIQTSGSPCHFTRPRKYWKCDGHTAHLSFGAKTGYRDPSF